MTQQKVLNVLKQNKDWMLVRDISKILDSHRRPIDKSLRQLLKFQLVMFKTTNQGKLILNLWKYRD